jgi:hypothetical protein
MLTALTIKKAIREHLEWLRYNIRIPSMALSISGTMGIISAVII